MPNKAKAPKWFSYIWYAIQCLVILTCAIIFALQWAFNSETISEYLISKAIGSIRSEVKVDSVSLSKVYFSLRGHWLIKDAEVQFRVKNSDFKLSVPEMSVWADDSLRSFTAVAWDWILTSETMTVESSKTMFSAKNLGDDNPTIHGIYSIEQAVYKELPVSNIAGHIDVYDSYGAITVLDAQFLDHAHVRGNILYSRRSLGFVDVYFDIFQLEVDKVLNYLKPAWSQWLKIELNGHFEYAGHADDFGLNLTMKNEAPGQLSLEMVDLMTRNLPPETQGMIQGQMDLSTQTYPLRNMLINLSYDKSNIYCQGDLDFHYLDSINYHIPLDVYCGNDMMEMIDNLGLMKTYLHSF